MCRKVDSWFQNLSKEQFRASWKAERINGSSKSGVHQYGGNPSHVIFSPSTCTFSTPYIYEPPLRQRLTPYIMVVKPMHSTGEGLHKHSTRPTQTPNEVRMSTQQGLVKQRIRTMH